ncbi:protocadherin-like wing polarity protein stan [Caerostris extrusa]|uniref:Protocadherin-like wing polarity protein stan n=1 Tax=Caerostris extrusa TaxID=172846 RepID=A0AAV4YFS8_CAEEX|nr:protocadherin-like wing polarity protein stan [Caerostris extrusa]
MTSGFKPNCRGFLIGNAPKGMPSTHWSVLVGTYRLESNRTPVYVRHLIRVDPRSGAVLLRRTLRCSTARLANLAPNPFSFHIESRSFRLSGSETESVIMPIRVRFGHRTPTTSEIKVQVYACFIRSQLIADLDRIIPSGVLHLCDINYDQPSDTRYAIEVFGSDLVAREDFCESSQSWYVSFPFTLSCPSVTPDKSPEISRHVMEINFHLPGVLFNIYPQNKRSGRQRRDNRKSENRSPYFDRALYVVNVPEEKRKPM